MTLEELLRFAFTASIFFIVFKLGTAANAQSIFFLFERSSGASVIGKANARPELENSQHPKRTRTVQDFLQRRCTVFDKDQRFGVQFSV